MLTMHTKTIIRSAMTVMSILLLVCVTQSVEAQVYGGNGIQSGLGLFAGVGGIANATNIRELILRIIAFILDIVLIIAVLAIIVAGVYLIVSNGNDENKEKAKKIIMYVVAGIILILFARVIVLLANSVFL